MTKPTVIRPRASLDLDDHFAYIAQTNLDTALRFFGAVRSTIAQIARNPQIGSIYSAESLRLSGLRKWAVKDFRRYLIFYVERDNYIEVVRILYGTQDLVKILEQES